MSTHSGQPRWQAILLDLDGTLVDDRGALRPENVAALRAAAAAGTKVVVATGRSELSTQPVLLELDLGEPAIVFNGAGVWCPRSERFLEERTLSVLDSTAPDVLAGAAAASSVLPAPASCWESSEGMALARP